MLWANSEVLSRVIDRSARACVVDDLNGVSIAAWPALAEHGRFPLTFGNVNAYVAEYDLDKALARMLETEGKIQTADECGEPEKLGLGLTIIAGRAFIPSAEVRASLVESMSLRNSVDVVSVPPERGDLVGWLLAKRIVEDSAASFAALEADDIDGLAFAISKSVEFANFMTSSEVTPSNVGLLVDHILVPAQVKDAILTHFTDLTDGSPPAQLKALAQYAVSHGRSLTVKEVARLASEGIGAELVLVLLEGHLGSMGIAELAPVLISLGGEYEKLSERNGKRPVIDNTPANRSLVERLQELNIANSHSVKDGQITVNMKRV